MIDISITRMSSKGQVVIPKEMRSNIKEGEKLMLIKNDGQIIIKKASDLNKNLKEDLEFAKKTEEAWKRYEKGENKRCFFKGKSQKANRKGNPKS